MNTASVGGDYANWVQADALHGRGAFKGPGAASFGKGELPGFSPSRRAGGALQLSFGQVCILAGYMSRLVSQGFFNSGQMTGILALGTVLGTVLGTGNVDLCKIRCRPS